ncbi:hypothetical protein CANCADRAFT_56096 [Tortispora caseinolytica NRRL Y-17796]|uniref:CDC20/Fizzy WD40 domain-containing protein n=1 Tax=Tortispora caseinolytica NRRL Y-17796 TaxID=767744 RepID=A0A1E4TL12_9ASCO|nr:hypothetical protein CANCADRAFT_56096 [Tortispora caseinolytica NRRL Y-17796]
MNTPSKSRYESLQVQALTTSINVNSPRLTPSKRNLLRKGGIAKSNQSPRRDAGDKFAKTKGRPSSKQTVILTADRYIPNRQSSCSANSKINPENEEAYQSSVAEACGLALKQRILEFKPPAPQRQKSIDIQAYSKPKQTVQSRRRIATAPERVLDAPGLVDDYYLNVLDWSSGNQLAIGLEKSVYVWNANTGTVSCLLDSPADTYVSSLKWSEDGAYLSVGLGDGDVQIWDVEEGAKLRSMHGHAARVGVMSWSNHLVSSGCRDGSIWNHDVRIAEHKVSEYNNHSHEVCGLEWRSDGTCLASGGNDNLVNIWDARSSIPKFTKTNHKAAVKALAWCPWQHNLLATGGGSYDKQIHFWSATTGARVNSVDAGSQVTSIKWSTTYKEFVTTHGYPNNNLVIWEYPTLVRHADIEAHESRVLQACLSPDGSTLATAASDESLKFWKIFEVTSKKVTSAASSLVNHKDLSKSVFIR